MGKNGLFADQYSIAGRNQLEWQANALDPYCVKLFAFPPDYRMLSREGDEV